MSTTFTTTIPTFAAGDPALASDLATVAAALTALTADWDTYVPTLTNLTKGNGSFNAKVKQVGKNVDALILFQLGSTSTMGTGPSFTLPVAPSAIYPITSGSILPGKVALVDSGTTQRDGFLAWDGTKATAIWWNAGVPAAITNIAPWTWTTGDQLIALMSYLAA